MMNQLIQLLSENARLTSKQLADMTGDTPQGVAHLIARLNADVGMR